MMRLILEEDGKRILWDEEEEEEEWMRTLLSCFDFVPSYPSLWGIEIDKFPFCMFVCWFSLRSSRGVDLMPIPLRDYFRNYLKCRSFNS